MEPCPEEALMARQRDMTQTRNKDGAAFNAKVVLAAIKGDCRFATAPGPNRG